MTAPVADIADSGMQQTMARIAQIQGLLASVAPAVSAASTTSANSSAFNAALNSANSTNTTSGIRTPGAGSSATGQDVVQAAKQYLGVPYVWGGESSSGIDCSGLVQASFKKLGIDLPRVAADQQKVGTPVASLADAQPGDLLFFGKPAYHVAIYLGDNKLIESPEPGKTVHITSVYQKPTTISRIVHAQPTGTVAASALTSAGINPAVAAREPQFAAAEARYRLPAGLLAAVAQQESGGNIHAVSPAGAQGLMQLMPSTAASMGVNAFDPGQAIEAAAKILSQNLSQFGTVPLALAAYNAGAGAVRQYGGIPPYAETQHYVRNITATLEKLS